MFLVILVKNLNFFFIGVLCSHLNIFCNDNCCILELGTAFINVNILFLGVKSLKCKCDICRDTNYTCETDAYCFTSIHQHIGGSIEHSYRYASSLLK